MSPVDYHAWTHRPKELGGTDPIDLSFLTGGGTGASYMFATKPGFTATGNQFVGWVDADTTDQSIFSVSTTTVTNDTIDIAASGLIQTVCYASRTTSATDWGIGTAISGANPSTASGAGLGFVAGGDLNANRRAVEIRFAVVTDPSDIVVTLVATGSVTYGFVAMHVVYWPLESTTWTDIL